MRHCYKSPVSRYFRCSYLKANKVSKSEGTRKVEYTYNHTICADAVYPKLSKSIHVCWNYSLLNLACFRHSVACHWYWDRAFKSARWQHPAVGCGGDVYCVLHHLFYLYSWLQCCLYVSDGYAPFMSLSDRDTMLVNESILAAPGPTQYDPKIPQDTVKVFRIWARFEFAKS